jgi:hypothetical protein
VRQAGAQRFACLVSLEGNEPREGVLVTFGAGCSGVLLRQCRQRASVDARVRNCGLHIVRPVDRIVRVPLAFHSWPSGEVWTLLLWLRSQWLLRQPSLVEARCGSHGPRLLRWPTTSETRFQSVRSDVACLVTTRRPWWHASASLRGLVCSVCGRTPSGERAVASLALRFASSSSCLV